MNLVLEGGCRGVGEGWGEGKLRGSLTRAGYIAPYTKIAYLASTQPRCPALKAVSGLTRRGQGRVLLSVPAELSILTDSCRSIKWAITDYSSASCSPSGAKLIVYTGCLMRAALKAWFWPLGLSRSIPATTSRTSSPTAKPEAHARLS